MKVQAWQLRLNYLTEGTIWLHGLLIQMGYSPYMWYNCRYDSWQEKAFVKMKNPLYPYVRLLFSWTVQQNLAESSALTVSPKKCTLTRWYIFLYYWNRPWLAENSQWIFFDTFMQALSSCANKTWTKRWVFFCLIPNSCINGCSIYVNRIFTQVWYVCSYFCQNVLDHSLTLFQILLIDEDH